MYDLMIINGNIVTMYQKRKIIPDGGLVINNKQIIDIGPRERIIEQYNAKKVIDASNKVIMPGLKLLWF